MSCLQAKIEYLKSIQSIIDRLSNASFLLKGWTVTLSTALVALAAKDSNLVFFLIAYLPTVFFWVLDSLFLKLERQYRVLYNKNANLNQTINSFDMEKPKENKKDKTLYWQCFFSKVEMLLYLPILMSTSIVMFISIGWC